MRNLWNRSIAFVLVLCMLLSVMPPLVLATETNTQPETVVYDFDLGHSALTCNNAVFGNQNLSRDTVYDDVSNYYDQNQLNWKYHSVEGATGGSNFMMFGGVKYNDNATEMKWNGICMYSKTSTPVTGTSFALTLRSPGEGNYKLTLDYGAKYNGAASGSIYLLPGNTTDIAAGLTAGNKLGSVNYENAAANNAANAVANTITFDKVLSMEDLTEGMVLTGTVRNVIDFGAFVDIGVHQDGLVHISQISDKYIKHPSEVLAVGDVVKVTVLSVDLRKKRIGLTMKGMN